jgi:DnaJ-class molecular chaperone
MGNANCQKCQGKGFIKGKDGTVSTCFDCLLSGNMDQHDENLKDSDIKI